MLFFLEEEVGGEEKRRVERDQIVLLFLSGKGETPKIKQNNFGTRFLLLVGISIEKCIKNQSIKVKRPEKRK